MTNTQLNPEYKKYIDNFEKDMRNASRKAKFKNRLEKSIEIGIMIAGYSWFGILGYIAGHFIAKYW